MSGMLRFWFAPVLLLVGGIVLAAVVDSDDSVDLPVVFYELRGAEGKGAGGYDVVAYFDKSEAVRGTDAFRAEYGGVDWLFESAESRDKFVESPERYIPQYGGHCAYGTASGYLVKGDPEAWTVKDGKLYLNYNKSVRNSWLADTDGYIIKSDKNWPGLLAEEHAKRRGG